MSFCSQSYFVRNTHVFALWFLAVTSKSLKILQKYPAKHHCCSLECYDCHVSESLNKQSSAILRLRVQYN